MSVKEASLVANSPTYLLAVPFLAIGRLGSRAIGWISQCFGCTKKTDEIALKKLLKLEENLKIIELEHLSQDLEQQVFPRFKVQKNNCLRLTRRFYHLFNSNKCYCLFKDNVFVGRCSISKMSKIEKKPFNKEFREKEVFCLRINIQDQFHNKGFGRLLFHYTCFQVINERTCVYLSDATANGIGNKLYGGEKTRQLFNVHLKIGACSNEYFICQKRGKENNIIYTETH